MGRLKLYDLSISAESIASEREAAYGNATIEAKLDALFNLIHASVAFNGGKPIKQPQGKGIIISRHRS